MTEAPYDDNLISRVDCENLWQQVLLQAVNDAIRGVKVSGDTASSRARLIREARDYIIIPNRDFNEVCFLAGMDPVAVRERVKPMITAAPSPEELAGHDSLSRQKRPSKAKQSGQPRRIGQPYTIAGRSFTRRQWAAELGMTYNAMNQAVHKSGSVEAVVIRRLGGNDK